MRIVLLSLILLTSFCDYYVLEVEIPDDDPKLVINSFFHPDSTLEVYIFEGVSILDYSAEGLILNANVKLYNKDGEQVASLSKSDSNLYDPYKSRFFPQPNEKYRIEVNYPGFPMAFGEEVIPEDTAVLTQVNLKRLDLTPDSLTYLKKYALSFTLNDPVGKDYYEIIVQNRYRGPYGPTYGNVELSSKDPIFSLFPEGYSLIFEDDLFDGNARIIKVEFEAEDYSCLEGEECYDDNMRLLVRKTSESYFRFNSTYDLYGSLDGNPLAEPVRVYSNIKNGFGIFAGYQTSKFPLIVPENQ